MTPQLFNIKSGRFIEGHELVFQPEMEGIFTMRAKKNGRVVREQQFKNLIVNQGLDRLAQAATVFNTCQVGTGTTAPAVTQTSLASYLANSGASTTGAMTYGNSPDYIATWTGVFQFTLGSVIGNLTEVGIGWGGTGTTLFSRALILDGGGNPTTFTVLADEQLEVTYQIKIYPPVNDVATTQNINGSPVSIIIRPYNVTGANWQLRQYNYSLINAQSNGAIAYTGTKVPITQSSPPSGAMSNGTATITNQSYVAGSYQQNVNNSWGVNNANGNIKTIVFTHVMAAFQVEYQTVIAKTSTQTLVLPSRLSWARH